LGFLEGHYAYFYFGCIALWFLNPALGSVLMIVLAFFAPKEQKAWRLGSYALASFYGGLLAFTQTSTGMVLRDVYRYYEQYRLFADMPVGDTGRLIMEGNVPFYNLIVIFLGRRMRLPPQSLSLACVFLTMLFFSLGFSRLARKIHITPQDELILWIISFLFAFNISQTGELLKQFLAASFFFYAYVLLADGSWLFFLPLLASLGSHNAAFMYLPLLPFARMKRRIRPYAYLILGAFSIIAGLIGPYEIVSAVFRKSSLMAWISGKASFYSSGSWNAVPKRNFIILIFYTFCAAILLYRSSRKESEPDYQDDYGPIEGLCVSYMLLCFLGFRASVLSERLIAGGSSIYSVFLLWPMGRFNSSAERVLICLETGFLMVSSVLLCNAALGNFGHYSMALMDGQWGKLLTSTVFDILRYRAA